MLAVIMPLAGGAVAAAFPADTAGTAAGSAAVPTLVVAVGGTGTVGDWIVAVLTFDGGTAGGRCVEFEGTLATATELATFAPELVVTEPTGAVGCAVAVCAAAACEAGWALAADATTTVDAFQPELVLAGGVLAGAADGALAAAVTEGPG
jgi:hypothetical protein